MSELTLDQQQAFYHLTRAREPLFITGGAGTGKSFIIQKFVAHNASAEKIDIVASTGSAAILVGGRTFHSYFGLGIMQGGIDAVIEKALKDKRLKKRLLAASTLIIDEVSMLPFEAVDCAESIARAVRGSPDPWGGIRVIAVGDFAQLPPVSKTPQKPWAFLGEAWASTGFRMIHLRECVRTPDKDFSEILNDIRLGQVNSRARSFLNSRVVETPDEDPTYLFPRRYQTEEFNLQRLNDIPGTAKNYETQYIGPSEFTERLRRDAPIAESITLKKGARVMLRYNDPKQRYVNGTIATVLDLKSDAIRVSLGHRDIDIEPVAFSILNDEGLEIASAKNFPINLAYASTIHKIQGTTLDKVHVDLKSLWEPGQGYVALSRVRSAEGLTISSWGARSIKVDPMVQQFYGFKGQSDYARGSYSDAHKDLFGS